MDPEKLSQVPLADPHRDMSKSVDQISSAIAGVIASGSYILGQEVAAFEQTMAQRVAAAGSVGVGSGTDALILALLASGVGAGDEVITVSHTAGATVAAIRSVGAIPVFVDISDDTYCMDPAAVEAAMSARSKAIIVVHLYGHPADIVAVSAIARAHGVIVIEDCAQAQEARVAGAAVGSIGHLGCFSFYPTKVLGALGDGGLVTSNDVALLDRVRMLRTYGWIQPQFSEISGGRCSRLDEIQAAILRVKLQALESDIARRRQIAERYRIGLDGLPLVLPTERQDCQHVYHLYVVRVSRRDELAGHLKDSGIGSGVHYRHPAHAQPGLASGSRIAGNLAVTESIVGEILSLPMYSSLSDGQQDRVIACIRGFFGK